MFAIYIIYMYILVFFMNDLTIIYIYLYLQQDAVDALV